MPRIKVVVWVTNDNLSVVQNFAEASMANKEVEGKVEWHIIGSKEKFGFCESEVSHGPCSISHMFKLLTSISPIAVLVPYKAGPFELMSETHAPFLHASLIGAVTIAPSNIIYSEVITNDMNGYLYSDAESAIEAVGKAVGDVKLCRHIAKVASENLDAYGYTEGNIAYMEETLFPVIDRRIEP